MQARIRDRANAFTELSQDHKEELGYIYANDVSAYDIPYLLAALQEAQAKIKALELKANWQYDAESNLHYCPVCNLTRNKSIVVQVQEGLDRERVLREALEFYAIKDNYQEQLVSNEDDGWDIYRKPTIVLDNGKIAREALGQEGK